MNYILHNLHKWTFYGIIPLLLKRGVLMNSEKAREIIDYHNGIASYYGYLATNLGDDAFDPELIKDEDNITHAKVALMALYFTTEKENIVKKKEIVGGPANEFDPKIIDDKLAKSIEIIAKKDVDGYTIGDYTDENPSNIIALIRNKFAHGKYSVDAENKIIHFYHKKGTIDMPVSIDDLFLLICQSVVNLTGYPKTNEVTRVHAEHHHVMDLGFKHISSREEAKKFLQVARFREFKFSTLDKRDLEEDALEGFLAFLDKRKELGEDKGTVNYITDLFNKVAYKNKCVLNSRKTKLTDEEIESILDYLDSNTGIYDLEDLKYQAEYLLALGVQKKMPNYEANPILRGLIYNMHLLNGMDQGEFDFEKLIEGKSSSMHQSAVECVVSGLLANFNALYIYPYEDVYLYGTRYAEDRFDQFDFSELDFSFINPKKLTIYSAPLDQAQMEYSGKHSEAMKQLDKVNKAKENLAKAEEKNNDKGIEYWENYIEKEYKEYLKMIGNLIILQTDLQILQSDYDINPDYFRNRAIVEGIRNAIAHGNITINKFVGPKLIDDITITFKDIYEGEVTFELEISIRDFEKLFQGRNMYPIIDFLNRKQKVYSIDGLYGRCMNNNNNKKDI